MNMNIFHADFVFVKSPRYRWFATLKGLNMNSPRCNLGKNVTKNINPEGVEKEFL